MLIKMVCVGIFFKAATLELGFQITRRGYLRCQKLTKRRNKQRTDNVIDA